MEMDDQPFVLLFFQDQRAPAKQIRILQGKGYDGRRTGHLDPHIQRLYNNIRSRGFLLSRILKYMFKNVQYFLFVACPIGEPGGRREEGCCFVGPAGGEFFPFEVGEGVDKNIYEPDDFGRVGLDLDDLSRPGLGLAAARQGACTYDDKQI